ncbi:hypothetical protein PUN28_006984 [Cardiocondyla obscurior]|uniref:Uncharacterized protein n=1 Tax=Cardiocondyla obscurior TaxID=286306 RepID=A0AAW2G4C6_9HYME
MSQRGCVARERPARYRLRVLSKGARKYVGPNRFSIKLSRSSDRRSTKIGLSFFADWVIFARLTEPRITYYPFSLAARIEPGFYVCEPRAARLHPSGDGPTIASDTRDSNLPTTSRMHYLPSRGTRAYHFNRWPSPPSDFG